MTAYISGSGVALPERVVTNEELAVSLGLDPEWIYKASGIRSRRWASDGTTTSGLACEALTRALANAALEPGDVDYLIFGTMTPDRFVPGSSYAVQSRLGLGNIPCLDIRATCCNLLYALQLAKALIVSETAKRVAICLAEIQSPWLRLTPEAATISMLFGDGASALIVSNERTLAALEVMDVVLASDGRFVDDLGVRRPGTEFGNFQKPTTPELTDEYAPRMNGQSVILQASRKITSACQTVMQRNDIEIEQVRWIVPHQANVNLLSQVARSLKFTLTDGVILALEQFGNTSSASMGIALDMLRQSGAINDADYLLLPAFGAGFTWGAGLLRA